MATDEQSDSDPLPYAMVDRSVKPAAALIASKLGVSFQHALGGLVEFWQLNGDPRELEALITAGKSEVVLERAEVARRFALAMAVDQSRLSPEDLASLHLLERRPDGDYRVRGMSRYFKPLQRRVQARSAAVAGGKASAKARAQKHGTAQPRSGAGSEFASEFASESLRGIEPSRRSAPEAAPEAAPNTADSGQRTAGSVETTTPLPSPPVTVPQRSPPAQIGLAIAPPDTPRETWLGSDFWRWAQCLRVAGGYVPEQPPRGLDGWWSGVMMTVNGDVERMCAAFEEFGQNRHWETEKFPFRAFMTQWTSFVPRAEAS